MKFGIFNIMKLVIGAYLLVSALTRRGGFFENKRLKCAPRTYARVVSGLLAAASLLLIANGFIVGFNWFENAQSLEILLIVPAIIILLGLWVFHARVTARERAEDGQASSSPTTRTQADPDREQEDGADGEHKQ